MKLLNVIGYGMSGMMCASLLVACADGRGTNGFRSYQFSKEERAKNLALKEARSPKAKQNQNSPSADDSAETSGEATPNRDLAPAPKGRQPEEPLFKDRAQSQVLSEPGKVLPTANPSGVPIQEASVKMLNVKIEEELKAGVNEVAKGLVKGITVVPSGPDQARTISLQATVMIGKDEVYMEANDVPVKPLKEEESVENFLFTLSKPCETRRLRPKTFCRPRLSATT